LALLFLRLKNIGHRDLKPENIIYFENNTEIIFKLADLGAGLKNNNNRKYNF